MKNLFGFNGKILSMFLSTAVAFGTQTVLAGGGGTGGGGSHLCFKKDQNKQILKDKNGDAIVDTIELYDLYEAREARRYSLVDSAGKSANELLNDAMKKLFKKWPSYALAVAENLKIYAKNKNVVTNRIES